jgi:proline dehydrogenase
MLKERRTSIMYRTLFLAIARDRFFRKIFLGCPLTRRAVRRFVPGDDWEDARATVAIALDKGLKASVGHLGEDARDLAQAEHNTKVYLEVISQVAELGWAGDVDVALNLTTLGLILRDGEHVASANTLLIAEKARDLGVSVMIDMESPLFVAKTMRVIQTVRARCPEVGYALQANLKRTEADCRAVAEGTRVRLCKGSYAVPAQALFGERHDIDLSYVRCLKALMESDAVPLVATHDPVMIEIAEEVAAHSNRGLHDFEFQMLNGIRAVEQERLVDLGHVVRVYVPFGCHWYDYAVRRFAERPSNLQIGRAHV